MTSARLEYLRTLKALMPGMRRALLEQEARPYEGPGAVEMAKAMRAMQVLVDAEADLDRLIEDFEGSTG